MSVLLTKKDTTIREYLHDTWRSCLRMDICDRVQGEASGDYSRGFTRLACVALRVRQRTRAEQHFPSRFDRPTVASSLLLWFLPPARPPAPFLFRRWVERRGHTCKALATPCFIYNCCLRLTGSNSAGGYVHGLLPLGSRSPETSYLRAPASWPGRGGLSGSSSTIGD